jgi:hypothetical protein
VRRLRCCGMVLYACALVPSGRPVVAAHVPSVNNPGLLTRLSSRAPDAGQRRAKGAAPGAVAHDLAGHLLAAELTPQVMAALWERAFQKPLHPASSGTAYPHEDPRPGFHSASHVAIASARTSSSSGPLAPLDGVFRPFLGHFGAEADGFPGQKGRSPDAGGTHRLSPRDQERGAGHEDRVFRPARLRHVLLTS